MEVLRPLKGGPQGKVQPIIRSVQHFGVTLSPLSSDWHHLTNCEFSAATLVPKPPLMHPPTASGPRNSRAGHYTSGGSSGSDLISIYINPKAGCGPGRSLKNYETISGVLGRGNRGRPQRTTSANPGRKHHNASVSLGNVEKTMFPAAPAAGNPNMSTIEPGAAATVADIILGQNVMKWSRSEKKETNASGSKRPRTKVKIASEIGPANNNKQISFLFVKKPGTAIKLAGGARIQQQQQVPLRKNIFNFNIHA